MFCLVFISPQLPSYSASHRRMHIPSIPRNLSEVTDALSTDGIGSRVVNQIAHVPAAGYHTAAGAVSKGSKGLKGLGKRMMEKGKSVGREVGVLF